MRAPDGIAGSQQHLPGLDGVRGLAIVGVLVLHTLDRAPETGLLDGLVVRAANFGWMGVDLFFVLSGFLITGILLDQKGKPGYFRTFYSRRVLRIVPVYVAFVLFGMYLAPLVGASPASTAVWLRGHAAWYWTWTQNILFARESVQAIHAPEHLWSLAVEEQFYLLWPLVVFVVTPKALSRVALACFVAAELARIAFIVNGAPERAIYQLLPTRMDTLAAGAFLACAMRDPALLRALTRWRAPVAIAACVLLAVAAFFDPSLAPYPPVTQLYAFPAIAMLCALLVLSATGPATVFAWAPLRFFGRYSYGMYIWHLAVKRVLDARTDWLTPRLVGGSYLLSDAASLVVLVTATTLVALVSWHLIEQPFLRLKRYVPYAAVRERPVPVSIAAVSP
jgi:peptidoglycan/LPS O-acetylase OafA/YrhL